MSDQQNQNLLTESQRQIRDFLTGVKPFKIREFTLAHRQETIRNCLLRGEPVPWYFEYPLKLENEAINNSSGNSTQAVTGKRRSRETAFPERFVRDISTVAPHTTPEEVQGMNESSYADIKQEDETVDAGVANDGVQAKGALLIPKSEN